MATKFINSQLQDNYSLKIAHFADIDHFTAKRGDFYVCFSEIRNLGKVIALNDDSLIEKSKPFFYENYRIFKRIKVKHLLRKYGFNDIEIGSICNEFNLDCDVSVQKIPCVSIKATILIDILFKKSDLILFTTAGLSYDTCATIYRRIYHHLKECAGKTVIVFEEIGYYGKTQFEDLPIEAMTDYRTWIERKRIITQYQ
jgi:hypothetical protein